MSLYDLSDQTVLLQNNERTRFLKATRRPEVSGAGGGAGRGRARAGGGAQALGAPERGAGAATRASGSDRHTSPRNGVHS